MCRICFVSIGDTPEKLDVAEIAATLMPALVRQGPHAYGWMTYNAMDVGPESDGLYFEKHVGRSDTEDAWKRFMYDVDPKATWFVGHTRFATHGDPKDIRNDHPIPHGNILGVHNGVLSNHEDILKVTGREDDETLVDSEAIFAAVNKWGPSKGLRRVRGNMVSIFTDRRKPHLLKIARTHGRQLTIGVTTKGNLIGASDQSALHLLEPDIRFDHFTTISENRLLVIRDGKIIQKYTFRKPEVREPSGYTPPPRRVVLPAGSRIPPAVQYVRSGEEPREFSPVAGEFLALARSRASRAERRGEMLFPKPKQKKPLGKKGKAQGIVSKRKREPNQNTKLYYYEGQLLTKAEYDEVIASEQK